MHTFPRNLVQNAYGRFLLKKDIGLLVDRNACNFYSAMFTPPHRRPVFHHLPGYCLALGAANNFIVRKGNSSRQVERQKHWSRVWTATGLATNLLPVHSGEQSRSRPAGTSGVRDMPL